MLKLILINKKGQALLESVIAILIIFLASFSFIEVARYLSFRTVVSSVANDLTRQIGFYQLILIEKNYLKNYYVDKREQPTNTIRKDDFKKISDKLESLISESLSNRSFSFFFRERGVDGKFKFDIKAYFIFTKDGIYLKINTCLPVLFSTFIFDKDPKYPKQNCLGHFRTGYSTGEFEWRVRSSAFTPWPLSGKIFYSGVTMPSYIKGLSVKDKHILYTKTLYQSVLNTQKTIENEQFEKILSESLISER